MRILTLSEDTKKDILTNLLKEVLTVTVNTKAGLQL